MSELPENLATYNAAHRTRERRENGWVELVGVREKKWKGFYHVYVPQSSGPDKRIRRERIIGTKAEIRTRGEAEDLHRTWIRRLTEQPVAVTAKVKVSHLCDDYVALRKGDWELGHYKSIVALFSQVIKPVIGELAIEAVTPEQLKKLVNDLPNRKRQMPERFERQDGKLVKVRGEAKEGISHSYAKKVITNLRAVFDLAHERELITKNPSRSITVRLKTPKAAKRPDKTVFPPQHLPPLLSQLDARDSLIIWLSMLGATRPNELFAVKGRDVGPTWVHIERALDSRRRVKGTKTEEPRYIALPPQLILEVAEWIRTKKIGPENWLFQNRDGNPVNRANFLKRRLRRAAVRAGITTTDVDFQMLRRSFSTVAQVVGLDVKAIQSQMGHSTPDLTASVYQQPIDARTAEQLKILEDMLRGRIPLPVDVSAKLGLMTPASTLPN